MRNVDYKRLGLDHLVRFSIRGIRDSFEAGDQDEDNGLQVTISLKNTEYLVCASREGGRSEVLDLTRAPAKRVDVSKLPAKARKLLRSYEGGSDYYDYKERNPILLSITMEVLVLTSKFT